MSATPSWALVLSSGLPFAWWGAILSISFIETPLKFRAPGITVPLAVGIGRIVFKALNVVEVAFAAAVIAGVAGASGVGAAPWVLLAVVLATLAAQIGLVRPLLDRRAGAVVAGAGPEGRSQLHLGYVAGEVVKLLALPALAVLCAVRLG